MQLSSGGFLVSKSVVLEFAGYVVAMILVSSTVWQEPADVHVGSKPTHSSTQQSLNSKLNVPAGSTQNPYILRFVQETHVS
jgi:hypothetical protein